MKKLLFVATAAALTLTVACKKEKKTDDGGGSVNIEQKQNAAYLYFGGTWCPPCGAYGKPTKEKLHEDAKNANAVFISFQVAWGRTDPFSTTTTETTASNFGVNSAPSGFVAGGTTFLKFGYGTSISGNVSSQQASMDGVYTQTALVNGVAKPTLSGNTLTVNTKNKFFSATSDTFFVQCYVTENNLTATQSSDASVKKNIHDFVWRAQSGSMFYGDQLVIAPTAGQVIEKNLTVNLQDAWVKANCDVNVIIWRKKMGRYGIENSYKTKLQ